MVVVTESGRRRLAPLLLTLGLVLAGPAQARDLPPIRESQAVNGEVDGSADSLSLADRVARLEGLLEGQALVEMLVRIEELQKDVQELRGQNEVYAHEVEGMKKRQRDLYMDIDRRLRQLLATTAAAEPGTGAMAAGQGPGQTTGPMTGQAVAVLPGQNVAAGSPAATQDPVPNVDPQAEQADYRQAFAVLKDGRYEDSITAFGQFLQRYPNGQYADNAVYWMGEANYVLRRFPQAIANFQLVMSRFPNSPKLADAMLKIGFSHYELQAWAEARQVLQDLTQRFPATTASQLGKNRLHQMKLDGH